MAYAIFNLHLPPTNSRTKPNSSASSDYKVLQVVDERSVVE